MNGFGPGPSPRDRPPGSDTATVGCSGPWSPSCRARWCGPRRACGRNGRPTGACSIEPCVHSSAQPGSSRMRTPRLPYFGHGPNRILGPVIRALRKARRLARRHGGVNEGPWPSYARLAAAPETKRAWLGCRDSPLRSILEDPDRLPPQWGPLKQLRWLQILRTCTPSASRLD